MSAFSYPYGSLGPIFSLSFSSKVFLFTICVCCLIFYFFRSWLRLVAPVGVEPAIAPVMPPKTAAWLKEPTKFAIAITVTMASSSNSISSINNFESALAEVISAQIVLCSF
jgi:hypothetical protein